MIELPLDIKGKDIECLPDTFFVKNMESGIQKLESGLYIPEENMKLNQRFIRPRWCQVYKKADNIKDFEVGDWVLMKHGHWSTSLNLIINGEQVKLWYITPKNRKVGMLAISKTMPPQLTKYIDSINS